MLVLLGPVFSVVSRPVAQGNPTEQRQTIEAIVNPRLSATARAGSTLTATYAYQSTLNYALGLTLTALNSSGPTQSQDQADTATAQQLTVTAGDVSLQQTINAIQGSPTDVALTVNAILGPRMTQTAEVNNQTATAVFQSTVSE